MNREKLRRHLETIEAKAHQGQVLTLLLRRGDGPSAVDPADLDAAIEILYGLLIDIYREQEEVSEDFEGSPG